MEKQLVKMVLEGITINHVGELVLNTQKTSNDRRKSRYTYLRCLEDIAQAFIFADKVIVSKKMSDVGEKSPGVRMLNMFDNEMIEWIEEKEEFDPWKLINNPRTFKLIASYLINMDKSFYADPSAWNDFITREFIAYFYPNPSDHSINAIKGKYTFGKNYISETLLEDYIPDEFINELVLSVKKIILSPSDKPPLDAIKQFIKNVALTHVLIWIFYNRTFDNVLMPDSERNFQYHVTRSTLLAKSDENLLIVNDAWRTLIPRLIAPTLNRYCDKRDDFPQAILKIKSDMGKDIEDFKKSFYDAIIEYKKGNIRNLEILKKDLEKKFSDNYEKRIISLEGSISIPEGKIGAKVAYSREIKLGEVKGAHYKTSLIHLHARFDAFEREADRLFPELI